MKDTSSMTDNQLILRSLMFGLPLTIGVTGFVLVCIAHPAILLLPAALIGIVLVLGLCILVGEFFRRVILKEKQ